MIFKFFNIIVLFFLTAILLSSCIQSPDDMCGKTFKEQELNNDISEANDFAIILKKGCTITITGYAEGVAYSVGDFFRFNTGEASQIRFVVHHTKPDGTDLFLYDPYGTVVKKSTGTNDFDIIDYTVTKNFVPMYIGVWGWTGLCYYTLTIEAS